MSSVYAIGDAFVALSDPARRALVTFLAMGPRRAGEIADALDMTAPTTSRHLRVLRESGVVEELHDGADARVRTYRLRREPFDALARWARDLRSAPTPKRRTKRER